MVFIFSNDLKLSLSFKDFLENYTNRFLPYLYMIHSQIVKAGLDYKPF
jgi:hypothetical protein